MSDVVPEDVVGAASYYQDVNGQIYKADAPANEGDTIIPFPSPSIDAHIGNFGVSGQPYMPATEVIEDRSVATQRAENVKYHPYLTDMKLAEIHHAQNGQLDEMEIEINELQNELQAESAKVAELEAEVATLQQQLADATKPPTFTTKA